MGVCYGSVGAISHGCVGVSDDGEEEVYGRKGDE